MAEKRDFTWKPNDIIEVTNISSDNVLLQLPSGSQRLDAGRTTRFTGAALDLPQFVDLVNAGKLKVEFRPRRKALWIAPRSS